LEILAYIAAFAVGLSLGLLGAGGSILTVPILVYLLKLDMVTATTYSLFIVGVTSLAGGLKSIKNGQVSMRIALIFGTPSLITAFSIRHWLLPEIRQDLFAIGHLIITKNLLLLLFFALLMIATAYRMIRPLKLKESDTHDYMQVAFYGVLTGIVTGFLGAGGGFLIIPALVLVLGVPMKKAVGTSLIIITLNTLLTFFGTMHHVQIDWTLLLTFSACSITGIFLGLGFSRKVPAEKLKPAFGWFVLAMGIYIIITELSALHARG
jgi:uncharacterized membrane protein YfcA